MNSQFLRNLVAIGLTTVLVTTTISRAAAQNPTRIVGTDSVVVVPGEIYKAGHFHRVLLGNNYRDEWTTPIKVPVFNPRTFHGGLKPTKTGGGAQTISLRFETPDGLAVIEVNEFPNFTGVPHAGECIADYVLSRALAARVQKGAARATASTAHRVSAAAFAN